MPNNFKKIVITGGPCAGKSAAAKWIKAELGSLGYNVLFVPETATELICGGVAPWTCSTPLEYQICQMQLQLAKEKVFERAAKNMNCEKTLIVCDRGMLDNKAYMSQSDFNKALCAVNTDEMSQKNSYDAVFHLVSAAKGAQSFYSTDNNSARTETAEEASLLDDRLISAWVGHSHLRIIGSADSFETKMIELINEIKSFLGEPEPFEIERRFLIEFPDIELMKKNKFCSSVEIVQTYLESENFEKFRLRRRRANGSYAYYHTRKEKVSDIKRIEIERRISQDEYDKLLSDAKYKKRTITKTRYCLAYKNQYFEIDVYPFWSDKAIMEIELCSENKAVDFPECVNVMREISGDASFSNFSLAQIYGE